jgi:hypothetical protein
MGSLPAVHHDLSHGELGFVRKAVGLRVDQRMRTSISFLLATPLLFALITM